MGSPTVALSDAAILTQVIDEALVSKGGKAHEQPSMVDLFAALQKVMELYAVDTHRAVKFKAILRVMHAGEWPHPCIPSAYHACSSKR